MNCMHGVDLSLTCPACEEMHGLCSHGMVPGTCDACPSWIENLMKKSVEQNAKTNPRPYLKLVWDADKEGTK